MLLALLVSPAVTNFGSPLMILKETGFWFARLLHHLEERLSSENRMMFREKVRVSLIGVVFCHIDELRRKKVALPREGQLKWRVVFR